MKVIHLDDVRQTGRQVDCPNGHFASMRYLIADDGMGFGLHRTEIEKGGPYFWHYKNHKEACYCVSGRGMVTNVNTGQAWEINPGSVYVLDGNEPHEFRAFSNVVLISVFNPPLVGPEVHDKDGSYAEAV